MHERMDADWGAPRERAIDKIRPPGRTSRRDSVLTQEPETYYFEEPEPPIPAAGPSQPKKKSGGGGDSSSSSSIKPPPREEAPGGRDREPRHTRPASKAPRPAANPADKESRARSKSRRRSEEDGAPTEKHKSTFARDENGKRVMPLSGPATWDFSQLDSALDPHRVGWRDACEWWRRCG
jgi:hypothetical protein